MLFPLDPQTPRSQIFNALNNELLHFLDASVTSTTFNESLFTSEVGLACWENPDTKSKFESLWRQLMSLSIPERQNICDVAITSQSLSRYYSNTSQDFPVVNSDEVKGKLSDLVKHLFSNTKKLADIISACGGESLRVHYQEYCNCNGCLCQFCGTELLAQPRANINLNSQWLSDYDHILSKDKYPLFAVHPDNLVPLCHTCNSKAKGAKELLLKKNSSGVKTRRLCFYPFDEHCSGWVFSELKEVETSLCLNVGWTAPNNEIEEKFEAWDEVYQVKARVEGIDADIIVTINDDCDQPEDLADFRFQIERKARPISSNALRNEPMKFWRNKLYQWLSNQGDDLIEEVWAMISQRRDDPSYAAVYGI